MKEHTTEEVMNYIKSYFKVQETGRSILIWAEKTNYAQTPLFKPMVECLKRDIKEYLKNVPEEIREKITFGFKISDLERLAENPFITISRQ